MKRLGSTIPGRRMLLQSFRDSVDPHGSSRPGSELGNVTSVSTSELYTLIFQVCWIDLLLLDRAIRAFSRAVSFEAQLSSLLVVAAVIGLVILMQSANSRHDTTKRNMALIYAASLGFLGILSVEWACLVLLYACLRASTRAFADTMLSVYVEKLLGPLTILWLAGLLLDIYADLVEIFAVVCVSFAIILFHNEGVQDEDISDLADDVLTRKAYVLTLSAVLLMAAFFGYAASSFAQYDSSVGGLLAHLGSLAMMGLGFWMSACQACMKQDLTQVLKVESTGLSVPARLMIFGGLVWFGSLVWIGMLPNL